MSALGRHVRFSIPAESKYALVIRPLSKSGCNMPTISGMAWERDPVWGNRRRIVNGLATPCELSRACCRQLPSFRPSLSVDKSIRDDRWALTSLSGGVYRSLVGREEGPKLEIYFIARYSISYRTLRIDQNIINRVLHKNIQKAWQGQARRARHSQQAYHDHAHSTRYLQ